MDADSVEETGDGQNPESDRLSRRRAGELSGLVLDVLRPAHAALTATEVQRQLTELGAGQLAYTTVVTILSRLHAQGQVERHRAGRAFAYLAVADTTLAARRMRNVLDGQHDRRDRDAVLAHFVHDLSGEDERQLRALLREIGVDQGDGTR